VRLRLVFAAGLLVALGAAGCGSEAESETAATTPAATAPATIAPAGPTREDLAQLGVLLADLPAGFSVRREGFVPVEAPIVAGFRRDFDPGQARLGESQLVELTSDVVLFETSDQADAALATILASLLGGEVEQRFANIIRASVGIEATNLQGQTLATQALGDGAVVSRATFDTEAGRAEAVFVVVRVGELHHVVFLIGPAGDVHVDDATDLARSVVPRLEAAAGAQFAA
jgi:hypothetical protein